MDQKYFSEIEARCEAATRGPWYEEGWALPNEDGDYVELTDDSPADAAFIAHARTDIPALIAEVERLTAENQGLRANSMIQEHIISGGRDPIKDGEIMRLIMDNAAKDQQIADLKESKEVIENDLINANMNLEHAEADNATLKKALDIAGQYVAAHAGNSITEIWPERFIKIAQAQQTHETQEAEK